MVKVIKVKKKKNAIIAISAIVLFVVIFFGILIYIKSTVNSYTYDEKNWINENSDSIFDIYVEPNLAVFSSDGKGVFYDYVNALKEDTGLNLNVVSADTSNVKLINKNTIDTEDIVFYRDHFVVIGANDLDELEDLNYKKIGVLKDDIDNLKYYLTEYTNIDISSYETYSELKKSYESSTIGYMVLPMYKYINQVIKNDYNISLHLDGLYSYYCLDFDNDNENYKSIVKKFYNKYESKVKEKISEYFLNVYYDTKEYTELEKESITNEDLIVGYIDNLPYEGMISNDFTGVTSTYLNKFNEMTGVTYKYIEYDNVDELSDALKNKKIDLALNYYSIKSDNYDNSRTLGSTKYVVLAHVNNNIVINSLYSLTNIEVDMLTNMNLKYNMATISKFEINDYANVKALLKNINEDSIIIIEKEVYDYYQDSSLKNYNARFIDNIRLNNTFLLNKDNEAFNKLFDFYLSTLSPSEIKIESVNGIKTTLQNNKIINFIVTNIIYILVAIVFITFVVIGFVKKVIVVKKEEKEDRLYYFDSMTNLKNRNYLNDNIEMWTSTKVYPQAIIVIDINKLKVLNDREGHEAGDRQIQAVAGVLIKTQRENSEIMRTDGDEFMIYLVGYDEKKIGTYIHKINKEIISSLPDKEYGISIGYAMITNSQTTIDDAINDSLAMINKSKGN